MFSVCNHLIISSKISFFLNNICIFCFLKKHFYCIQSILKQCTSFFIPMFCSIYYPLSWPCWPLYSFGHRVNWILTIIDTTTIKITDMSEFLHTSMVYSLVFFWSFRIPTLYSLESTLQFFRMLPSHVASSRRKLNIYILVGCPLHKFESELQLFGMSVHINTSMLLLRIFKLLIISLFHKSESECALHRSEWPSDLDNQTP